MVAREVVSRARGKLLRMRQLASAEAIREFLVAREAVARARAHLLEQSQCAAAASLRRVLKGLADGHAAREVLHRQRQLASAKIIQETIRGRNPREHAREILAERRRSQALGVLQAAARTHIAVAGARLELLRRKRDACCSMLRCGLRVLQARECLKELECFASAATLRRYVPIWNAKETLWRLKADAAARTVHRVYLGMLGRKRVRRTIFERKLWASKELRVYVEVMRLRMLFAQHKKSEGFHLAGKALAASRSWNTLMGYTARHKQARRPLTPPPGTAPHALRTPFLRDGSPSPLRIPGFSELELRAREAAENERRLREAPPKRKSVAAAALLGEASPRMSAMPGAAGLGPRKNGEASPRFAMPAGPVLGPRMNGTNGESSPSAKAGAPVLGPRVNGTASMASPRTGFLTQSKSAPNGLPAALSPHAASGPGPRFSILSGVSSGSACQTPHSKTSRPTTPRKPASRSNTPRLGSSSSANSVHPPLKMAGDHPLQAQLQNWVLLARQEAHGMYSRGELCPQHKPAASASTPEASHEQLPAAEPVVDSEHELEKLQAQAIEEKLTAQVSPVPADTEFSLTASADHGRSLSPDVGPRGRWQILKQFALNRAPLVPLELPATPRTEPDEATTPTELPSARAPPTRRISSLPPVPPLNFKACRPTESPSDKLKPRPSPKTSAPSSAPSSARRPGADRAPVVAAKARGVAAGVAGGRPPAKESGAGVQPPAAPGSRNATPARWR